VTLRLSLLTACLVGTLGVGCATTVDGSALPADTYGPTTTAPTTTAPPTPKGVAVAQLESKLVPLSIVMPLVGQFSMSVVDTSSRLGDNAGFVSDGACVAAVAVGDLSAYAGSGWIATRGNEMRTGGDLKAEVSQLLTVFPLGQDAAGVVRRSFDLWRGCSDRQFTAKSKGARGYWSSTGVTDRGTTINGSLHQTDNNQWTCNHTMTAKANAVAEVMACGLSVDTPTQADTIAQLILATIPG
jgi:hypothetical protein